MTHYPAYIEQFYAQTRIPIYEQRIRKSAIFASLETSITRRLISHSLVPTIVPNAISARHSRLHALISFFPLSLFLSRRCACTSRRIFYRPIEASLEVLVRTPNAAAMLFSEETLCWEKTRHVDVPEKRICAGYIFDPETLRE